MAGKREEGRASSQRQQQARSLLGQAGAEGIRIEIEKLIREISTGINLY
jgi:hypothetical protein